MVDFIHMTIGDWLDKKAAELPDKECAVHPYEGLRYTTAQFKAECDRVARGLMAMGVKKGDHVAIWATNRPQWVQTQFATAKIGAVLVTVNTNYKKYELEYLMKQSDSMTLIMTGGTKDNDYTEHIYAICPELKDSKPGQLVSAKLPFLKNVIFLDEGRFPHVPLDDVLRLSENVSEEARAARQAECDRTTSSTCSNTSGTTASQGVMLTHYNLINNGKIIGIRWLSRRRTGCASPCRCSTASGACWA
jgi:fatty-acyl-CoA synthase